MKKSYWHEFIPKSWEYVWKKYSWGLFKSDLLAGMTVGVVALPLSMALAIASGVSPERGLYTAIIAGFLISLLGGSRFQIGGPTGAFVVVLYNIVQRSGYGELVLITLFAGCLLLIAAFSRLGRWVKYIPYPLVIGFTTGIAVIIFSSQVKDFLGLKIENLPADFIPKWTAIFSNISTFDATTFCVAFGTLMLILGIRRFIPVVPWGIVAVVVATLATSVFDLPVETIMMRYGEMKRTLPFPEIPALPQFIDWHLFIQDAFTVAFLAAIESLLSAIVADGMGGGRYRANAELMGQGFANMASVMFGGIPATGAIARTATSIKTGAKTPVAGMIHAVTLFLMLLLFAPWISQVPLAALSAVLMMVAWNMSELHHFFHLFKAPLGDIGVLLSTFLLTVFVDLTVAVEVGMILGAFLFMKRVSDISKVTSLDKLEKEEEGVDLDATEKKKVPPHVEVYEISGPFFFGIAYSLKNVLANFEFPPKAFILRMRKVPVIDASGMQALTELILRCKKQNIIFILSGVSPQLLDSLKKFKLIDLVGKDHIFSNIDLALKYLENPHAPGYTETT